MKLKKSHLKELIKQAIIESDEWWSKLSSAEQSDYIKKHPGSQKAKDAKEKDTGDDVGGPAYPNVPKGAKSSKQAKQMMKQKTKPSDSDDVGGPAHPNVPKKSKIEKEMEKAVADANAKLDAAEKDLAMKKSKLAQWSDDKKKWKDGKDTESDNVPNSTDLFKAHFADILNKKADAGNSEMIDTEYHGPIAIDYVDRAEEVIIGSTEDGEQVEIDHADIIRFHNDDWHRSDKIGKEKQTKETDKAAKEFGHKDAESLAMKGSVDDIWNFQDELYDKGYIGNNETDRITKLSRRLNKSKNPKKERQEIFKLLTVDKPKQSPYYESIKESTRRRHTVKEVRMWMKTLEENRYKKVYNSDCRRVAWMVNNIGENLENMPISMRKKWTKAQYGRERYLANEFLKSQKAKLKEIALRDKIRNTLIKIRG